MSLQDRFEELRQAWAWGTLLESSTRRLVEDPDYRAIVELGPEVVPLLLRDLQERGPAWWHSALKELTGCDPTTPEMSGKIREISEAWVAWGRERGYLD